MIKNKTYFLIVTILAIKKSLRIKSFLILVLFLQSFLLVASSSQSDQSSLQDHVRLSAVGKTLHNQVEEGIKKVKAMQGRVVFTYSYKIDEHTTQEVVYAVSSLMPHEKKCRVIVTSRKTSNKK